MNFDFNKILLRNLLRLSRYEVLKDQAPNDSFRGHLEYEIYLIKRRLVYLQKLDPVAFAAWGS